MLELHLPSSFEAHSKARSSFSMLHHYTGQQGLVGIVGSGKLWATQVQYMNNSTEFGLALGVLQQRLAAHLLRQAKGFDRVKAYAASAEALQGLANLNIFAACFCESPDLLSQWRGYSQGSYGYAIGFRKQYITEIAQRQDFVFAKCIYSRVLQATIADEIVQMSIDKDNVLDKEILQTTLSRCGAFFKDPSFSEEQEWRLVAYSESNDDVHVRPGKSSLLPYYEIPMTRRDAAFIDSVRIGPCPHPELAEAAVRKLLMRRNVMSESNLRTNVIRSTVPFRDW